MISTERPTSSSYCRIHSSRLTKGADDHKVSPHVIRLAASGWQKVQNDHNLSLRAIGHDRLRMAKRFRMTIICLCMSSGSPPQDDKRRRMTIICLCVPWDLIVSGWQKGVRNDHNLSPHVIGLAVSRLQKSQNDHNLSLRAIGLYRLRMSKRCEITKICLRLSSGLPPLDDKRRRITIMCLYVPLDTIVSEWRKDVRNDHNLSPHVIGLVGSRWQKAQNDHNLSLLAIGHDCLRMVKSCVEWPQFVSACHRARRLWMTKRRRMTITCLCVPSDMIVSGW